MKCVSNIQNSVQSFKGSYKTTKEGNKYYHSNIATTIGVANTAILCGVFKLGKRLEPTQTYSPLAISAVIGLPLIAVGLLCDHFRNKEQERITDKFHKVDFDEFMSTEKNIKISKNLHPYKQSDYGLKFGIGNALLSAAFLTFLSVTSKNKKPFNVNRLLDNLDLVMGALFSFVEYDIAANMQMHKKA